MLLSTVMAGLVPAIPIMRGTVPINRDPRGRKRVYARLRRFCPRV